MSVSFCEDYRHSHIRAGLIVLYGTEGVGERLISDNVERDKCHRTGWGFLSEPGCRLESETVTVSGRAWRDENDSGVDYTVRYCNLSGFMMSVTAGIYLFNLLYSNSFCCPKTSKILICHYRHRSWIWVLLKERNTFRWCNHKLTLIINNLFFVSMVTFDYNFFCS